MMRRTMCISSRARCWRRSPTVRTMWMTRGALGGTRMPTAIVNTLVGIVDHALRPVEAVDAARFHAEGASLEMESRIYWRLRPQLEALGWKLRSSMKGYDRAFALVFL